MGPSLQAAKSSKADEDKGDKPQEEKPKVNHPRYDDAKFIVDNEQNESRIQIDVQVVNETEFRKWEARLKEFKDNEYALLPLSQSFRKTQFCGSSGICTILYEDYPFLLSDEIVNRHQMKAKYFEETELWYLVYSLLEAAHFFHSRSLKVGDVRPGNVFINSNGQVKIGTQFSWPQEQTNYLKTAYEKEITYLSPEEMADLDAGKLEDVAKVETAEAFSVGLTCLDAAILEVSNALYGGHQFDCVGLERKFKALESLQYSEPLVLLIESLCSTNVDARSRCSELVEWLQDYDNFILDLEHFEVNNLSKKLFTLKEDKAASEAKTSKGHARQSFTPVALPNKPVIGTPYTPNYLNQPPLAQSIYPQGTFALQQNLLQSGIQQSGQMLISPPSSVASGIYQLPPGQYATGQPNFTTSVPRASQYHPVQIVHQPYGQQHVLQLNQINQNQINQLQPNQLQSNQLQPNQLHSNQLQPNQLQSNQLQPRSPYYGGNYPPTAPGNYYGIQQRSVGQQSSMPHHSSMAQQSSIAQQSQVIDSNSWQPDSQTWRQNNARLQQIDEQLQMSRKMFPS